MRGHGGVHAAAHRHQRARRRRPAPRRVRAAAPSARCSASAARSAACSLPGDSPPSSSAIAVVPTRAASKQVLALDQVHGRGAGGGQRAAAVGVEARPRPRGRPRPPPRRGSGRRRARPRRGRQSPRNAARRARWARRDALRIARGPRPLSLRPAVADAAGDAGFVEAAVELAPRPCGRSRGGADGRPSRSSSLIGATMSVVRRRRRRSTSLQLGLQALATWPAPASSAAARRTCPADRGEAVQGGVTRLLAADRRQGQARVAQLEARADLVRARAGTGP